MQCTKKKPVIRFFIYIYISIKNYTLQIQVRTSTDSKAGKVSEVVTQYLCLTHSFACSQPGQSLFHFNTEVNRWRHPRVEWIAPFYINHFTGRGGGVGAESKDITLKNRWVVKLSAVALWANGIYCMPWLNAERTAVLLFFYCLWCLWLSLAQWLFETRWRPMFLSPQCFADYRKEWKVLMCQTPAPSWASYCCTGVLWRDGELV